MQIFNKKSLSGLALFWVIYMMPLITFYIGLFYYNSVQAELQKNDFLSQSEQLSGEAPEYCFNNIFWTNRLIQIGKQNLSSGEFDKNLAALLAEYNQSAAWAILQENDKVFLSKKLQKYKNRNWKKALSIVSRFLGQEHSNISIVEDNYLRKFFGPHLQIKKSKSMRTQNEYGLLDTDFMRIHPLFWARKDKKHTVVVLFPTSLENKKQGIKAFLTKNKAFRETFLVSQDRVYSYSDLFTEKQIHQLIEQHRESSRKLFKQNDHLVYCESLPENHFIVSVKKINLIDTGRAVFLLALVLAFLHLMTLRTFSIEKFLEQIRVRSIVFAFIGFSNVLPLMFLAFFVQQYLNQKLLVMIDEKKNESIKFMRMIEEAYLHELELYPITARKIITSYADDLKNRVMPIKTAKKLHKELLYTRIDFNFIASPTYPVLARKGFLKNGKMTNLIGEIKGQTETPDKFIELTGKIGGAFISFWNQTPISQKTLTEIELVTDMVFQKPIDQSLHMIVEILDRIGKFGLGTTSNPSIAMLFSFNTSDKVDYIGIFQLPGGSAARKFMADQQSARLANAYGLKVIYQLRSGQEYLEKIDAFDDEKLLLEMFDRLKDYPPTKAETVLSKGNEWICTGFRSKIIPEHRLISLFPLKEIQEKLERERFELLKLFVLNIFIVLALSYIFSQTLLRPIKLLDLGTKAIDARNFDYRLPDLGDDEFGKMADIFNDTLVDLQEMSIARVVQQSLFPDHKIETGNFDLFGKSITLADLGGDYFDFFTIDKNHFGAILGDVAGHGVGAAMIMAMAKSATINSTEHLTNPVELTQRLHNLIYRTKTKKQKKIMTFQYLLVSHDENSVRYCNAGGCNPFLVNGRTGKIEEVSLPAAALGAFKKGKFDEVQLEFEPEDVLVLYTDGIVEARNESGEEIGYPRFKKMLLECWSPEPEQFYNSVFAKYQDWLGKEPAQDDLTMLFLSLPGRKKSL